MGDHLVFDSIAKARSWLVENPGHKPCPTLWFKDNADAGEDEDAEVGEGQEDSYADDVEGTAEEAEAEEGEKTVEGAAKENTAKSRAKESVDEKYGKTGVDQEQEGFDADSEEADTDAEGSQKKKKLKVKKAAGVKVVKSTASASGDDTDSSRKRSSTLTQKNAPPCIKRKEKREGDKRLSGFLHTCDSHWFPSWTEARPWLEQNEDHLSFSTSMGISGKEDKTCSGKKAMKQKEMLVASSKKVKDQTKKKSKQSASGVAPLAVLQAAMEDEIRSSQVEGSGTKSPDMFESEEENGKASEGDKTKVDGKEKSKGKAIQPKKQKKTPESCRAPSKENEESESEDSGEEMGNSKSRMIGMQLEKKLDNSSLKGGTSGKEKAGDKQSKPKGNKDAEAVSAGEENDTNVKTQKNKSDVVGKAGKDAKVKTGEKTSPTAGNPSKAEIKKKKEKEEESSSSDSDSDTEAFTGAEDANISTGAKKVVNRDVKKG